MFYVSKFLGCRTTLAGNVQGLAMCRYSVLLQFELVRSKDNKAGYIFYGWALLIKSHKTVISVAKLIK